MKLLIAIPALNEEASIESIIHRSLAARPHIIATSPVTDVAVTVVSDGSTDRTVELASRYADQITLIVFEKNRGYGAAIQEAWRQSDADLLGFLDADGTCDPALFADLCRVLVREGADLVLGCRLHGESSMPSVRWIGNAVFASVLSVLSSARVRDTASGMRVLRRDSLARLLPLPDGLHFTPAMSARALLSEDVKLVEMDIPYAEREGRSKLRPLRDGVRFLRVIMEAALLYRPSRPLAILALVFFSVAVGLMLRPTAYYLQNRAVQEWMIYRFVVSHLTGTIACLLLCASYLTGRIVRLVFPGAHRPPFEAALLGAFLSGRFLWPVAGALLIGGGLLVLSSFVELVRTGATYEHWSRFIALSFSWTTAFILVVTRIVDYVLGLLRAQLAYMRPEYRPDVTARADSFTASSPSE